LKLHTHSVIKFTTYKRIYIYMRDLLRHVYLSYRCFCDKCEKMSNLQNNIYAVFNTISLKIYIFINVWLHTIQTRFKLYTQTPYDDNNFRLSTHIYVQTPCKSEFSIIGAL